MRYQDQKIKAIARLTIAATLITILLILSLIYPDRTQSFVQHLPLSRYGDSYGVWLTMLVILVAISWAVDLGLLFTSPDQEVTFVRWSKRWRKTPLEFEQIEFDIHDPDYRKPAWRYLLERRRR